MHELATARTGPANRYLAYGTMLPPLAIESPMIELDWFHYNCPTSWPAYRDAGTHRVPAVVHCAWRYGDAAAVVLVNVDSVEHSVRVPANAETLRLPRRGGYTVQRILGGEPTEPEPLTDSGSVSLALPPRRVVLLEITPTNPIHRV